MSARKRKASATYWGKVSLKGIEDVADLKEAINKRVEPELKGYAAASFTIKDAPTRAADEY